jgi:hypothetical protein
VVVVVVGDGSSTKRRNLTEEDLMNTLFMFVVGGNGQAIAQAARLERTRDVMRCLRQTVFSEDTVTYTWSAASTCMGPNVEHGRDKEATLDDRNCSMSPGDHHHHHHHHHPHVD